MLKLRRPFHSQLESPNFWTHRFCLRQIKIWTKEKKNCSQMVIVVESNVSNPKTYMVSDEQRRFSNRKDRNHAHSRHKLKANKKSCPCDADIAAMTTMRTCWRWVKKEENKDQNRFYWTFPIFVWVTSCGTQKNYRLRCSPHSRTHSQKRITICIGCLSFGVVCR